MTRGQLVTNYTPNQALRQFLANARVASRDGGNVFNSKSRTGQRNGAAAIGSNQGTRNAAATSASSSSAKRSHGDGAEAMVSNKATSSSLGEDYDDYEAFGGSEEEYSSDESEFGSQGDGNGDQSGKSLSNAEYRELCEQRKTAVHLAADNVSGASAAAAEYFRRRRRVIKRRPKGVAPTRGSERLAEIGRNAPAGSGSTAGDGDGEGHESATRKRRKSLAGFPRQFGAFLKKFGFLQCGTAADGCCLFSSVLGVMGVITAHQANNPDTITTQYKRMLRSKACGSAASAVDTWDETMPVWAFRMKSSQDAANGNAEEYRRTLKSELEQLQKPGAFNFDTLEYVTWQLGLEVGRPIVVLNLQGDGLLGTHFKLYACGDNQSHVNVLQDLELVLGLGSDRGPLVLVREGPTKASGHFTYLVNAHGPDIEARERAQFLFRLGALQPVARGAVQTSGGDLPNLTRQRVSLEPPRLGSRTEGGSAPLSHACDVDGEDEDGLPLQAPALRTLGIPRASQPSATEPSREAVEAKLHAEIAELKRALQQKSTQLRRVDDALEAAAEASDVQIAIGCAAFVHRSKRSGPGRGLLMWAPIVQRQRESDDLAASPWH
jgi:hypothetical protein